MTSHKKLRLDQLISRYFDLLKYLAVAENAHIYWIWDNLENSLSIYVCGRTDPGPPGVAEPLAPFINDLAIELGEFILENGGDLSNTAVSILLMPSMALAVDTLLKGKVRVPTLPNMGVIEIDARGGMSSRDWGFALRHVAPARLTHDITAQP